MKATKQVSLDQFSDGIVVLDFFAYWCVPCRKVSTELEEHVQQYYAGKNGNPAGKPVQVLSLNIEQGRAARTRQYIRQTGASLVLDDVDGRVYKALGGRGIPYVIVLAKESGQWNVLYAHAGYEGVEKIRPSSIPWARLPDDRLPMSRLFRCRGHTRWRSARMDCGQTTSC